MTIKRNGEKVILKGGKVSCSCCGCVEVQQILDTRYFSGFYYRERIAPYAPPYNLNTASVGPYPSPISFPELGYELILIATADNRQFLVNPLPGGACKQYRLCHRFLCRKVRVEGGEIVFASNTEFGGPTTNEKRFWDDICEPEFGDEATSGTYLYVIDFFGFKRFYGDGDGQGKNFFKSDSDYEIAKYKLQNIGP
jgi:hypothetical protein